MGPTAYSIPEFSPMYGPLPYLYRGCRLLVVVFRTTPEVTRALVPEPLVPNADDLMFLMTGQMNSDEFETMHEAFLAVPASLDALTGNYAVALYLDNDAAIASGREVWGWPKKAAHLEVSESDGLVVVTAERGGVTIIDARLEVEGPATPADLQLDATWFNLKLIPSVLEGAPPDVMQITSTTLQNVRLANAMRGRADISFRSTPTDPLGELIEVREVVAGVRVDLDCDLELGEVVHDYLGTDSRAPTPEAMTTG